MLILCFPNQDKATMWISCWRWRARLRSSRTRSTSRTRTSATTVKCRSRPVTITSRPPSTTWTRSPPWPTNNTPAITSTPQQRPQPRTNIINKLNNPVKASNRRNNNNNPDKRRRLPRRPSRWAHRRHHRRLHNRTVPEEVLRVSCMDRVVVRRAANHRHRRLTSNIRMLFTPPQFTRLTPPNIRTLLSRNLIWLNRPRRRYVSHRFTFVLFFFLST